MNSARLIFLLLIFAQCFFIRASTVLDLVNTEERFSSLNQQIDHFVRIKEILSNTTANLTLIAPTNDAYLSFDFVNLENKLKYFIIDGTYDLSSLPDGTLLETYSTEPSIKQQQRIRITSNSTGIFVGHSKISESAIQRDNGRVYPVQSAPDLPSLVSEELATKPTFSIFTSLLKKSSPAQDIDSAPRTLFAPTDEALSSTDDDLLNYLRSDQVSQSDLQLFLQYHVSPVLQYAENLNGSVQLPTLISSDSSVVVTNSSGNVSVNGVPISHPNLPTRNGVVHGISRYLFAPTLAQKLTLRQLLIARGYSRFVDALDSVGKGTLLDQTDANITIFVPPLSALDGVTDEALASSNLTVAQLLSYHLSDWSIVYTNSSYSQDFYPSQLRINGLAQRLNVTSNGDGSYCGGVKVTQSNVAGSNGVVHFLEGPLSVPPSLKDWLSSQPGFSQIKGLLNYTQVSFPSGNPFTLLLPVDSAFDSLPDYGKHLVSFNSSTKPLPQLLSAVAHHVLVDGALFSSNISSNGTYRTLNEDEVTFFFLNNGSDIYVNNSFGAGAKVIRRDVLVREGTVQVVDNVLIERSEFDNYLNETLAHLGLTTFSFALERVGLLSRLGSQGPFVVFAPTNSALESVDLSSVSQADLEKVLRYHIVEGATFDIDQFKDPVRLLPSILPVEALGGFAQQLRVARWGSWVTVNRNTTLNPHIAAANGVVYVIDGLISFPPNITTFLATHPNFTSVASLINDYDAMIKSYNSSITGGIPSLLQTLVHTRKLTGFLPTNEAWSNVPSDVQNYLLIEDDPQAFADLGHVILYHLDQEQDVTKSPKYSHEITGRIEIVELEGEVLVIEKSASTGSGSSYDGYDIVLNSDQARVVLPDNIVESGVVHGIDHVLLPPSFRFTLDKALKGMEARLFLAAVQKAKLGEMLTGDQNYTLFAPNDLAFIEVEELSQIIDSNTTISAAAQVRLSDLIKLHIVKGNVEKITPGEMYTPLLPNYVLIGGSDGRSIHMMNMSYYSSTKSMKPTPGKLAARGFFDDVKDEIDVEDDIEKDQQNSTNVDDVDDDKDYEEEEGDLTSTDEHNSTTSAFSFTNEGRILSTSRTRNGIIHEIDIIFVPDPVPAPRSYGWLIFIVAVIVLVTVGLIGYYFYRRRQTALSSESRLLD